MENENFFNKILQLKNYSKRQQPSEYRLTGNAISNSDPSNKSAEKSARKKVVT